MSKYNNLIEIQTDSMKLKIDKRFLLYKNKNIQCKISEEKISMTELAGIWIILGASFFFVLFMWGVKKMAKITVTHMSPYHSFYSAKT